MKVEKEIELIKKLLSALEYSNYFIENSSLSNLIRTGNKNRELIEITKKYLEVNQ